MFSQTDFVEMTGKELFQQILLPMQPSKAKHESISQWILNACLEETTFDKSTPRAQNLINLLNVLYCDQSDFTSYPTRVFEEIDEEDTECSNIVLMYEPQAILSVYDDEYVLVTLNGPVIEWNSQDNNALQEIKCQLINVQQHIFQSV